jgi:thiol-disulfide isomerase/thioredoxin
MSRLLPLLAAAALSAPALALADDAPVSTTLELQPRALDWEGNKERNLMYMPSGRKLTADKPAFVTKEPAYRAKPRYAVINLGNTDHNEYAIAFDEPEGQEPHLFADLNHDGDLTNDGSGTWDVVDRKDESINMRSTLVFDVRWKDASGKETAGKYGLNIYRSPDRDSVNYYRAGALTGKIAIGGKTYEVFVHEQDNDGVFDKLYDPASGELKTKPVLLDLDGDRFDARATFGFRDVNYMARFSPDGRSLTLVPTSRFIRLPRPGARPAGATPAAGGMAMLGAGGGGGAADAAADEPKLLGAGVEAPDFAVTVWDPARPVGDEPRTAKLSDYKGKKIVVVDFWATWCGPCMKGLPHFNKVAESAKGQDVVFLAVNSSDDAAAFERFARTRGKEYAATLVRDPAGRDGEAIMKRYNVRGIPAQFVIGKDGKIVTSISGYTEGDTNLETALKKLGVKLD